MTGGSSEEEGEEENRKGLLGQYEVEVRLEWILERRSDHHKETFFVWKANNLSSVSLYSKKTIYFELGLE